jgi:hypothetical protein
VTLLPHPHNRGKGAVLRWLNVVGLTFGMIGVLLIFIWGPPQPSFQRGVPLVLEDSNVLPNGKTVKQNNEDIAAQERFYRMMSQLGLVLIFVGFGCQLVASWRGRTPG